MSRLCYCSSPGTCHVTLSSKCKTCNELVTEANRPQLQSRDAGAVCTRCKTSLYGKLHRCLRTLVLATPWPHPHRVYGASSSKRPHVVLWHETGSVHTCTKSDSQSPVVYLLTAAGLILFIVLSFNKPPLPLPADGKNKQLLRLVVYLL